MSDSLDPELPKPFPDDRSFSFLSSPYISFDGDRPKANIQSHDPSLDMSAGRPVDNAESYAIERLVNLKRKLRTLESDMFWDRLMVDLTSTCGAQSGFVVRKIPAEEQIHATGRRQCTLLGMVFYYDDGDQRGMERNKYFVGENPLSHVEYDKPCLVPDDLGQSVAGQIPFAAKAYLSIPLFSQGKCLAHLGLMWSDEGLRRRNLSWLSLEMTLYSLEDMVVQRILLDMDTAMTGLQQGLDLSNPNHEAVVRDSPSVQPHDPAKCHIQPLKPYARSLSHELRTPMQGVVGMLDVMHATVREAIKCKNHAKTNDVFRSLKESIEMVQDSARRVVEAADNVVHAYDLNMQVPETPRKELDTEILAGFPPPSATVREDQAAIFVEGDNISANPYKRRRDDSDRNLGPPPKQRVLPIPSQEQCSPRSSEVRDAVHESEKIMQATPTGQIEEAVANMANPRPSLAVRRSAPHLLLEGLKLRDHSLKLTKLRDLLRLVVNESLHVGGRPDFAASRQTQFGEKIEVSSRFSNGHVSSKVIDWSVDPTLPDTLLMDNRDLAKLVSCVFLNAIKFTNTGAITVYATVKPETNHVSITIRDTGSGIPEAFLPNLFKPFSRENSSTTQSKDGLGLGLLVAKGLARKMGGDLVCVRSSTSGPDRGSEFEIRLPINHLDACSNSPSPPEMRVTPPPCTVDRSKPGRADSSINRTSFQSSSLPRHITKPIQQPSPSLTDEGVSPSSSYSISTPDGGRTSTMGGANFDSKLGEKYPLTLLVAEDNRINRRVLVSMLKKLGYHDVYEACDGKEAVRIIQDTLALRNSEEQAQKGTKSGNNAPGNHCHHASGGCGQSQNGRNMKPVDLVLMDLWMPEMDGYQATARIFELVNEHRNKSSQSPEGSSTCLQPDLYNEKPHACTQSVPTSSLLTPPPSPTVLAVSADVTDEALGRASKVGMKGYMTKPYKLSDLEKLIVEFCISGADCNGTTEYIASDLNSNNNDE
ncbi:hypothetical protein MPDQ_001904 [Monascus purpureus]|uniref:histidine kinase n=1 Tax=Monascus purpureus TaxID=5098 RepID=A0A507QQB6_MONPU|nr:hypothetical protein MPDQ_001904 [Monascus purpureus]BDD56433.1 hypothetical protein MAP00_001890 [Monascus purpureus]